MGHLLLDRPVMSQDPMGNVTLTTYDAAGRALSTTDPRGVKKSYAVVDLSDPALSSNRTFWKNAPSSATGYTTTFAYDSAGLLATKTLPPPDGKTDTTKSIKFTYLYNPDGSLKQETKDLPGGSGNDLVTVYTYEQNGRRTYRRQGSEVNGSNVAVKYVTQYNKTGQLEFVQDEMSSGTSTRTTNTYDPRGRLIKQVMPDPTGDGVAPIQLNFYDQAGNLHTALSPASAPVASNYDELGRVKSSASYEPLGSRAQMTAGSAEVGSSGVIKIVLQFHSDDDWSTLANSAIEISDASSVSSQTGTYYQTEDITLTSGAGTGDYILEFLIDPSDAANLPLLFDSNALYIRRAKRLTESSATYSNNNLMTSKDGNGYVTSYEYDKAGRATAAYISNAVNPTGDYAKTKLWTKTYDSLGQLTSETQFTVGTTGLTTKYEYDLNGRLVKQTDPAAGSTARQSGFAYDKAGNLTARIDSIGMEKIKANAFSQSAAISGNYNTTTYAYDALNRQTRMTLADPDGKGGSSVLSFTTTVYDDVNNKVIVTDPAKNVTTYTYDEFGRLTQESTTIAKTSTADAVPVTRTYGYDNADNLIKVIDRNGRRREFTIDELNQVKAENWFDTPTATTESRKMYFRYDAAGRLLNADSNYTGTSDSVVDFEYTYDGLGQVASDHQVSSNGLLVGSYDPNGNRVKLTATVNSNSGFVNEYAYDNQNVLTRLWQHDSGGSSALPEKLVVLTNNLIGQQTIIRGYAGSSFASTWTSDSPGGSEVSGFKQGFVYDAAGRLQTINRYSGATAISQFGYVRDANDRITQMSVNGQSRNFANDDQGQLTSESSKVYKYDANFNRVDLNSTESKIGKDNRLIVDGTWTYQYDAEGNLIRKDNKADHSRWIYAYDHRNRLTSATYNSVSSSNVLTKLREEVNIYDAQDRRIERKLNLNGDNDFTDSTDSDEIYAYDGSDMVLVLNHNASDAIKERYLWDPSQVDHLLASDNQSSTGTRWYVTDHQGSIRKVVDSSSNVTALLDYDAFGNLIDGLAGVTAHNTGEAASGSDGNWSVTVNGGSSQSAVIVGSPSSYWLSNQNGAKWIAEVYRYGRFIHKR